MSRDPSITIDSAQRTEENGQLAIASALRRNKEGTRGSIPALVRAPGSETGRREGRFSVRSVTAGPGPGSGPPERNEENP
ncbi:hypothetical protein GCM10010497_29140 [Streptomyces cinereoruber]|uniref:Uncharacterized protein n=1 Tax=Streptomyces cinereoruber TaxID=67260 RepID=A0AAV4KIL5_9ACTN|nr:hypothetical protein GCM10010497_29140 [Streptomyces cinereoruber]